MTRFAFDPPTLVRLAEGHHQVNPDRQIVAANSIQFHALDLLLRRVQSGVLSEPAARALHKRMTELNMRLLGDRVSRRTAWQIALTHGWTTIHDAEYLAVAKLQANALVTAAPELTNKAAGIVTLAKLEDLLERRREPSPIDLAAGLGADRLSHEPAVGSATQRQHAQPPGVRGSLIDRTLAVAS